MQIKTKARLILTVPKLKQGDDAMDIMLAAEMHINDVAAIFVMPKTKTKVGVRLHIAGKKPKVTK